MKLKEIAVKAMDMLKESSSNEYLKAKYYEENPEIFSRDRKIDLEWIISFILKKSMKSYDLRINDLQDRFDIPDDEAPTKQAISKARSKVDWQIFSDFLKALTEMFLRENIRRSSWKGYQIYAIDGSDCHVPTTKGTLEYFGDISSKKSRQSAGATTSTLTDVLNGVIIDAAIEPYKTSERTLALQHLEKWRAEMDLERTIIVCDRGYPSYDFLWYFYNNNIKFLMRVKEQFTKMRLLLL